MTPNRAIASLVLCAFISGATSSGCRSMRPVSVRTTGAQPSGWKVSAGDEVQLTLADGQRVRVTVKAASADEVIAADGTRYPFADIRTVERRELSPIRTAALIAGGVLAAVFLYMLAWATAVGSFWAAG